MTTLALLQIQSVRRFSKFQSHITMVTPEVNEVARRQLRAAGSHVVPVDLISPPWQISASWWTTVFTKLQAFSLGNTTAGRVDKVAFVDLDAFILKEDADSIFDQCGASEVRALSLRPGLCPRELHARAASARPRSPAPASARVCVCAQLCAVRDAANLCPDGHGGQSVCAMGSPGSNAMMNAGVFVAKPSAPLLESFRSALAKIKRPYATLPEQEFLSAIYLDGEKYKDSSSRFQFISADYGQCWANAEQLKHAKIVHNCARAPADRADRVQAWGAASCSWFFCMRAQRTK